jgi:hypothetical protein
MMFHTYVLAASNRAVDIDRASYLMDRKLYADAIEAMRHERDNKPRHDATYGAQWGWDYYCQRHLEKYGTSFEPDISPTWDQ